MKIDQFEVLEAIMRTGSFRAAAQELNRAQSAVSYAVKMLEQDLGVSVFDREGYRPKLSEAGELIFKKGKTLLAAAVDIKQTAALVRGGQEPLVRVDVSPTAPLSHVLPVLKLINKRFPQTQLRVCMEIFGGEQHVRDLSVDLSLTSLVTFHDDLDVRIWRHIKLIPVASQAHPLAMVKGPLADSDLARHVQIVMSTHSPNLKRHSFGIAGGQANWLVTDFSTKKAFIMAGLGWGNLPQDRIGEELADGRLVRLDWENSPFQDVKLSLVRLKRRPHGPVARSLWDEFIEHCEPGDL